MEEQGGMEDSFLSCLANIKEAFGRPFPLRVNSAGLDFAHLKRGLFHFGTFLHIVVIQMELYAHQPSTKHHVEAQIFFSLCGDRNKEYHICLNGGWFQPKAIQTHWGALQTHSNSAV